MQAIRVKYLPTTETKNSRIKASCAVKSLTIDYPHELSGQAIYRFAAELLAEEMGWTGQLLGGCLPDGSYCFVFDNSAARD